MTTTTHDTHDTATDRTRQDVTPEPSEHRLREIVPAIVSVGLLFGLLMAGAYLLKEVAGLGLWLVGS